VFQHPSLKKLGEYAGGLLDEPQRKEVARHIESCPRCAKKVEESGRFDSLVSEGLVALDEKASPADCLPPVVLADYFDGSLSPEQHAAAEQHLADCPACRSNLLEVRSAMEKHERGEFPELGGDTREKTLAFIKSGLGPPGMRCPACDAVVESEASECPDCGSRLRPATVVLLCMACRQPIPAGSRFCPVCGAAIAPPRRSLGMIFARRESLSALVRAHIWLALSLGAVGASFCVPRYFMQFIGLGLIFGAKWILDQAQFKIYNEILKSLKKDAESEKETKRRARRNR
jgi:anti-sigma factor RsiW